MRSCANRAASRVGRLRLAWVTVIGGPVQLEGDPLDARRTGPCAGPSSGPRGRRGRHPRVDLRRFVGRGGREAAGGRVGLGRPVEAEQHRQRRVDLVALHGARRGVAVDQLAVPPGAAGVTTPRRGRRPAGRWRRSPVDSPGRGRCAGSSRNAAGSGSPCSTPYVSRSVTVSRVSAATRRRPPAAATARRRGAPPPGGPGASGPARGARSRPMPGVQPRRARRPTTAGRAGRRPRAGGRAGSGPRRTPRRRAAATSAPPRVRGAARRRRCPGRARCTRRRQAGLEPSRWPPDTRVTRHGVGDGGHQPVAAAPPSTPARGAGHVCHPPRKGANAIRVVLATAGLSAPPRGGRSGGGNGGRPEDDTPQ